jgi:hypothetical protein
MTPPSEALSGPLSELVTENSGSEIPFSIQWLTLDHELVTDLVSFDIRAADGDFVWLPSARNQALSSAFLRSHRMRARRKGRNGARHTGPRRCAGYRLAQ